MTSFNEYVAHGNAWLYVPVAILLGALHGFEPGHSKTVMAAFIISIRGTVAQAILLGLSATISHTALIWVLAFVGLRYSNRFNVEAVEPYLQGATGVIVIGMAAWMFRRARCEQTRATNHPHGVAHTHETQFTKNGHHREHAHSHPLSATLEDEHQKAHAVDLERRFANRNATTGQIILFGLTGGLMPCPSAFAVLLLCLQLKAFVLGFALVLAFSMGLALTLVSVGTIAAVTARQATKRFSRLGELAYKVPYISSTILAVIGVIVAFTGVRRLLE